VLDSQKVVLEAARALAVEEAPQTSRTRTPMTLVTVVCGFSRNFSSSGRDWWQFARLSALRAFGTLARLLQACRPTSSFGHPLDQAQRGPRVPDSCVVAAWQFLVLVATPP
jgi:hypothetical protein